MSDYLPEAGVEVVEADPSWPRLGVQVMDAVRAALGVRVLAIQHIGSTAVPGLPAKPVIDLDLTVADPAAEAAYVPELERLGFQLRIREPWWHEHRGLRLADPACNLHVFGPGAPEPVRHRIFRDWLRTHPEDLRAYAETKRQAAADAREAGEHVMDYNARKQAVVREIYDRAFVSLGLLPRA